jgi:hypothetical protein
LQPVERCGAFSVNEKLQKTLDFASLLVVNVFHETFAVALRQCFENDAHSDFAAFWKL